MQPFYILPIIWSLVFLVMILSWFGPRLRGYFHLVNSQELMGEESWNKLNQLWQVCDADITIYDFTDGKKFYIRVSYKGQDRENVSKTFENNDVNTAVSEAHEWAAQRGILKLQ